jgi:hypothetical protein
MNPVYFAKYHKALARSPKRAKFSTLTKLKTKERRIPEYKTTTNDTKNLQVRHRAYLYSSLAADLIAQKWSRKVTSLVWGRLRGFSSVIGGMWRDDFLGRMDVWEKSLAVSD